MCVGVDVWMCVCMRLNVCVWIRECVCVCVCEYGAMCESVRVWWVYVCEYVSDCCLSVRVCPSVVENSRRKGGVVIHIFNHQRRIIRPLGANWEPLTNHKCQLTSVARPWHMTQATDKSSHHPIHPPVCLSSPVCLDQVTHHHHALSLVLSLSLSLTILIFLMLTSLPLSRERRWKRESKERIKNIPIGFQAVGISENVKSLTFHSFVLPYASLSLCLSSNTKDCEELIGSKRTDTWHIHLNPVYFLFVACPSIA